MVFADDAVRALLTTGSEVEVGQLVPVEALVSANVGEIEDGGGKAREAADVYFVGGEPRRGVDGVVVCALHVWELLVPADLLFVDHHGKNQGHRMIEVLHAAIGAGGHLVNAEALVEGAGKFRAKLKSIVGKECNGASPERYVAVDEDIGGAWCGELGLGCGVHVGTAAEAISEEEDVDVAPWCDR